MINECFSGNTKKSLGVVVPVYNAAPYLRRCVDSIISQQFNVEDIILVDDGSNDGSGQICDEYAETYNNIRVVHKKNEGMIKARYTGLCQLNSDYVTYIDADDWLPANAYEDLEKLVYSDVDMIQFRYCLYWDDCYVYEEGCSHPAGFYDRNRIQNDILPTMIWDDKKKKPGFPPNLWGKIIKRNVLLEATENALGLDIAWGEDRAIVYPLVLRIESLLISSNCNYMYRQHKGNKIPLYIREQDFYKKTWHLYEYLEKNFSRLPDLIRQLDYMYANSVRLHLKKYGENVSDLQGDALFPFHLVEKDDSFVLHGAGALGKRFYKQVMRLSYGKMVLWTDSQSNRYDGYDIQTTDAIQKVEFDKIVIAISNKDVRLHVAKEIEQLGIPGNKIIADYIV